MSWDPVWESIFNNQEWGKYPGEELIRFISRNFYKVPIRKEIKILEVGCGPGANLWYMAREGYSVYGIDGSSAAIAKAQKRLDAECPGWTGELIVGDMLELPYKTEFFDAIIDNEAIYCNSFEVSKLILSELSRVTKSNGKLYSRTFATGTWGDNTGEQISHNSWLVSEGPLLGKGASRFTEYDEITDLFKGFDIKEIELITKTLNNLKHSIKEWIIIAEKK